MPTSAFAAGHVDHTKSGHESKGDKQERGGKDRSKGKKNKPRDVENMPGCKFYRGKVYCEHKPDGPKPAPIPRPDVLDKENPDRVQTPPPGGFGVELEI